MTHTSANAYQSTNPNNHKLAFAAEVLNQLGGRAFTFMVGAKDLLLLNDHTLQMKIGGNTTSANRLIISLDATDTYTMRLERHTFSRKTFELTRKVIHECSGLYCDQIREVLERWTGLSTRLPRFA